MTAPAQRPRAVFDCNVLLQAATSAGGPAAECFRAMDRGAVEVLVSAATLREARAVFDRTEVRALSPTLTDVRVAAFLDRYTYRATLVRRVRHRSTTRGTRRTSRTSTCVWPAGPTTWSRGTRIFWRSGTNTRPPRSGSGRSPTPCASWSRTRSWISFGLLVSEAAARARPTPEPDGRNRNRAGGKSRSAVGTLWDAVRALGPWIEEARRWSYAFCCW